MNANTRLALVSEFEGKRLDTYLLDGDPVWLGDQAGLHLGYASEGRRLVTLITTEWAAEFVEGEHYVVLKGERLAAFKASLGAERPIGPRTAHLLVLKESGFYLAAIKTKKPVGIRLRRFLAEQVLPQIARTGRFAPEPEEVAEVIVLQTTVAIPAVDREARLAEQLALRDRIFQAHTLRDTVRVLHALNKVDDTVRAAYEVTAAEIAVGRELPELRPVVEDTWYTPTQLARLAGVTPHAVGLAITRLGIRGAPGLSRQVMTKARGSDKLVLSYIYNEDAARLILGVFRGATPPDRAA